MMHYFPKKKWKGNVNYDPWSKKKTKTKKRTNLPFVRSGTVRSASTVRPGSIPKKKGKGNVNEVKKNPKTTIKERTYLFVRSGTVRPGSISKKRKRER